MFDYNVGSTDLIRHVMDVSNSLQLPLIYEPSKIDISGWATIAMAVISMFSLWAAVRANKKHATQIQQQIDIQKQQWADEFFLKYKQQKFIEFRASFIELIMCVRNFQNIMGPGFLSIDFFKPDASNDFVYTPVITQLTPENFLADNFRIVYKFIDFLLMEELFINEIPWVYKDLNSFSHSFLSFLHSVKNKGLMNQSFEFIDNHWVSKPNKDMRYLYMRHWTKIVRDNVNTSMLHAIKNKECLNDLSGDNSAKMHDVANNDAEFHYYLCMVNTWIDMWKETVDSVLIPTSNKLKVSQNPELEQEQTPASVKVPQYIKVIPDEQE